MTHKFLPPEDEEEIRIALENSEHIPNSFVEQLLKELDYFREKSKVDGEIYNLGRSEGRDDVKVLVRKIVDPEDKNRLNIDGVLKEVSSLVNYKGHAEEVISYIYQSDALKDFAYECGDDEFSISDLLRKCYHLGKGTEE